MIFKRGFWLVFLGLFASSPAWTKQSGQPVSIPDQGALGQVRCHDQSYVPVTADPEQAVPLQLVAKLKCDENVRVLSDPQGYTVKIQTASGTVGYVTHYEVSISSMPAEIAATHAVPDSTNAEPHHPQVESQQQTPSAESGSRLPEKGVSLPRVYVSDTQSWTAAGGFSTSSGVAPGNLYGGYDPDLVDIYQDFASGCEAVVVTQEKDTADYAVLFDKGSSKRGFTGLGGLVKINKVTVLSRHGDVVYSQTAHSADTAVKLTCTAIRQRSSPRSDAAR